MTNTFDYKAYPPSGWQRTSALRKLELKEETTVKTVLSYEGKLTSSMNKGELEKALTWAAREIERKERELGQMEQANRSMWHRVVQAEREANKAVARAKRDAVKTPNLAPDMALARLVARGWVLAVAGGFVMGLLV